MLQGDVVAGAAVGVASSAPPFECGGADGLHGIGSRDRHSARRICRVHPPALAVIEIPLVAYYDTVAATQQVMLRFQDWVRSCRQISSPS